MLWTLALLTLLPLAAADPEPATPTMSNLCDPGSDRLCVECTSPLDCGPVCMRTERYSDFETTSKKDYSAHSPYKASGRTVELWVYAIGSPTPLVWADGDEVGYAQNFAVTFGVYHITVTADPSYLRCQA